MAVAVVVQDDEHIGEGRMTLEESVAKLDTNSAEKDAAALNAKDAFVVLVIGGEPAAATAAIYAASIDINRGSVAVRFGRQVTSKTEVDNFTLALQAKGPECADERAA